ncbi:UDP-N-acetylmuramoylalanine--D-glutamate ligase [Synergistales bacterium]|nr:UDP-N-acetylmuramoylalanine--D-glutamate ligase [Synergistales bacterium]
MKNIIENFKRFTVIGAGVSGTALALLARRLGYEVFVSDEKENLSPASLEKLNDVSIPFESGGHTARAFESEAIVLSSGVSPEASCVLEAKRRGVPVIGELDFVAPRLSAPIIGVTGSNGKSTLTSLIGHILKKSGLKVGVGGNLGEAASFFTVDGFDCIVLELSSFQLYWAHNLNVAVGTVTNLAPDHIDWHGSYKAYVAAKAKLFSLQGDSGWKIVQDRDCEALSLTTPEVLSRTAALSWDDKLKSAPLAHIYMGVSSAFLRREGEESLLFKYDETTLLGRHNLENIAMALTAARLFGARATIDVKETLSDFKPLPHRCELAGVLGGVTYIDDSKGTNVAASVTAMASIEGRKVVILGGKGKGEDYAPLADGVSRYADAAVLLGAEKNKIEAALREKGFTSIYKMEDAGTQEMKDAVLTAKKIAKPGMIVLLSPACTSWDMYESYKKRGEHFCDVVRELRS